MDVDLIRSIHVGLNHFSDDMVLDIFIKKLGDQGILCHKNALREFFIDSIKEHHSILEIGPFDKPILGDGIKYFDVCDRDGLQDRARKERRSATASNIPDINFVSPNGDLSVVNEKFMAVYSSHVIEHQLDLIDHLLQVGKILEQNGAYYLIVPDQRYCFDHFLNPSNIAEIIDTNKRQLKTHSLRARIEHSCLHTHNDSMRHWLGDHGNKFDEQNVLSRISSVTTQYEKNPEEYIDSHSWQFTPETFGLNMTLLINLDYIPFRRVHVHTTPFGRQEFTAVLYK